MKEVSLEKFYLLKKTLKVKTQVRILSQSMEPFISKGEEILVSPIASIKDVKKMTPVVFWQKNILICHFYVKCSKDNLILTKGLNSNEYDLPVEEKYILGVVVSPRLSSFKRLLLKLFFK